MAKHIPERMCIGCRKMFPKNSLLRFVSTDGTVEADISGKKQARGAYICKNNICIDAAKKKKALSKHFKMPVSDSIYDEAKEYING